MESTTTLTDSLRPALADLDELVHVLQQRAIIKRSLGYVGQASQWSELASRAVAAKGWLEVPVAPEWQRLERLLCAVEDIWAATVEFALCDLSPRAERLLRAVERVRGTDLESRVERASS